tara:strand:- start:1579 stop:3567 length:1989 start_codon:yes stop_codon:yes gene_type:complete
MAGLQKTWSGDLTTSIAKRLIQAQQLASAGKKQAMGVANHYGVDPMLRRGEFFGHGLGTAFSDFLPRSLQHRMPNVTTRDPSYISRGQSSTALYGQSSPLPPRSPWPGPSGGGGGGINPEIVPNDAILGNMINVTPGGIRNTTGGIKVHDEKLGKFVSEVGESLSGTMNVLNTDNDVIKEGMFSAQQGLTATQDQLENVGDTLEDKLDAIINELRTQNDLIRRAEDQRESDIKETTTEQRDISPAFGSGTDRIAGVKEDVSEVLRENQAEDALAYDNNLSPMLPEKERGGTNTILHGKEQDLLTGKVFDGPDTGYPANTSGNIVPINNFFTRGQTGAASKTGGLPSGMGPVKGKSQDLANVPEVKSETEKLAKAVLVPVQAAGAMTLGILGNAFSNIPMIGPVAGAIKQIASPIASMFGVKNSVATNLAAEVGNKEDEQKRQADTAAGVDKKESDKKNWFSKSIEWIKNIFNRNAEKGAVINTRSGTSHTRATSNYGSSNVSLSAEKGATIINGPKTGYNVNVAGTKVNAHGTELVTSAEKGVQITPLDNFATDGIQGNEVTPGGDIAHKMSFERGGRLTPRQIRAKRAQEAAMNAPQSNKTNIVHLNSKEREFKRMMNKVTKIEPVVINTKNAKSTAPPQEMNHITNVGDPGLDVIYPSLV